MTGNTKRRLLNLLSESAEELEQRYPADKELLRRMLEMTTLVSNSKTEETLRREIENELQYRLRAEIYEEIRNNIRIEVAVGTPILTIK